jgi:hypothetical protein
MPSNAANLSIASAYTPSVSNNSPILKNSPVPNNANVSNSAAIAYPDSADTIPSLPRQPNWIAQSPTAVAASQHDAGVPFAQPNPVIAQRPSPANMHSPAAALEAAAPFEPSLDGGISTLPIRR